MLFARWALAVSALGVIGAFGATLLAYPANPRVIFVGRRLSIALGLASLGLIAAQLYAWFGVDGFTDHGNVGTMLSITLWGLHWTWLAFTAIGVIILLSIAARFPRVWIYAAGAAALAVAVFVPLIGHGATHGALTRTLHQAHVFGAGLWMGSLGVTLLAGIGDREQLLASLRRFAPVAFSGAAMVAASGVAIAWQHLSPLSLLWTTEYGQTLCVKLAGVLAIGGLGFVNWRRPRRGVAIAEIAIAVLVVLTLTAILSVLEPPMAAGH